MHLMWSRRVAPGPPEVWGPWTTALELNTNMICFMSHRSEGAGSYHDPIGCFSCPYEGSRLRLAVVFKGSGSVISGLEQNFIYLAAATSSWFTSSGKKWRRETVKTGTWGNCPPHEKERFVCLTVFPKVLQAMFALSDMLRVSLSFGHKLAPTLSCNFTERKTNCNGGNVVSLTGE